MRVCNFLLLFVTLFLACKEPNNKSKNDQTELRKSESSQENDTVRLVKLFSSNALVNTKLLIKKDTLLLLTCNPVDEPLLCSVGKIFFNIDSNKFVYARNSVQFLMKTVKNDFLKSAESTIVDSLGSFKINYAVLSSKDFENSSWKSSLPQERCIQFFNGKYYVVGKSFPREIYRLDSARDSLVSFATNSEPFEVIGMFLFDLDKDGYPEVFVADIGTMADEDAVSYTVYSFRKGPYSVESR